MSFRKLIDIADQQLREELDEYYIVSKSRMDNLTLCFEQQVSHIKQLTSIIAEQQEKLAIFQKDAMKETEVNHEPTNT